MNSDADMDILIMNTDINMELTLEINTHTYINTIIISEMNKKYK